MERTVHPQSFVDDADEKEIKRKMMMMMMMRVGVCHKPALSDRAFAALVWNQY